MNSCPRSLCCPHRVNFRAGCSVPVSHAQDQDLFRASIRYFCAPRGHVILWAQHCTENSQQFSVCGGPQVFPGDRASHALSLPHALPTPWLADWQLGALHSLLHLPSSAALPGHHSTRNASRRCPAQPMVPTVLTGCRLLLQACQHRCPEAGRGRRQRTRCCFPRSRTRTGSPPATPRSSCMMTATRSTSNSTATSECRSPCWLVETMAEGL